MAYNQFPGIVFGAGYTLADSKICLTTNTSAGTKLLTEVIDDEANATTGDARKVIFGIMEAIYAAYNAIAVADRPTQVTISKSVSTAPTTGVVTNTYAVRCYTAVSAQEISNEPA